MNREEIEDSDWAEQELENLKRQREQRLERKTIFSPCRQYRYTLWRSWADDLFVNRTKEGYVMFIGLNPSTADETLDDPTIRRCMDFTKRWGYLTLCMTNLFAWRDTDPRAMKKVDWPIQPKHELPPGENDKWLCAMARGAALVVAAWGRDGNHLGRAQEVINLFCLNGVKLHHLGLNDDGTPKHPLYLKATTLPVAF